MRKVLIITYYWPPAGGGAVQRITKFCKYLPEFGWEPIILTVKNGTYDTLDKSLEADVSHIAKVYYASSLEPHLIFNFLKNKIVSNKSNRINGNHSKFLHSSLDYYLWYMAELIRLNLFIPDSRIGWYFNACKRAKEIIAENEVDLVFSTSPPYTVQLIGLYIKREFNLPWIVDVRDPWVENTAYNTVPRLKIIKLLNGYLEKRVLNHADVAITIGETLKGLLKEKKRNLPIKIITNGYDEIKKGSPSIQKTSHFFISHMGFMDPHRIPLTLFKILAEMMEENAKFCQDFRFRAIGNISVKANRALKGYIDTAHLIKIQHLPYQKLLPYLYEGQILLVIIDKVALNKLIITGKLFEYLPTGNPILGIGPVDGDAANILKDTGAGQFFNYDDEKGIKDFIIKHYQNWRYNRLNTGLKQHPKYKRRELTKELAWFFNGFLDSYHRMKN